MTLQEIVKELESLKDRVNDEGKGVLTRLQGELKQFEPAAPVPEGSVGLPVLPATPQAPAAPEKPVEPVEPERPRPFKPQNVMHKPKPKKKK